MSASEETRPLPPPVRTTHTHTVTFTVVHYANPYLVCDTCGVRVEGYIDAPEAPDLHFRSFPCRHMAMRSTCRSWGPVDGCRCRKPCTPAMTCTLGEGVPDAR